MRLTSSGETEKVKDAERAIKKFSGRYGVQVGGFGSKV